MFARLFSVALGFTLVAACSGESASDRPQEDAGPTADAGTDAEVVDDAQYRAAVEGSRWEKLANAPTINGKQDDVYFVTKDYGFSVNGEGRIFRTEDGGGSWTKLIEQPGTFFRSILMVDQARGFAGNIGTDVFPGVTDTQPLYQTSDRGQSWTKVDIAGPTVAGICNMHKLDDSHLYAVGRVGGPAFFVQSSDGGATWSSRDLSDDLDMLIDVRMTSPNDGMIVGRKSSRCTILNTNDGGASWSRVFRSDESATLCWKISFPSAQVGYVSIQGGEQSTFARTRDGGQTWEEKPLIAGEAFRGLGAGFITDDIGWMADDKGAVRTTDGGETWTRDSSLGPAVNRFRFVDRYTGYAIGTTIYKLQIPTP